MYYAAEVMKVQVQILTDTSVRVSWERILNMPKITHYTVFYSRAGSRKRQAAGEQSRNVQSTEDSLVISNLSGGTRSYQFAVIAVATVDDVEILGERPVNPVTPTSDGGMDYYDQSVLMLLFYLIGRCLQWRCIQCYSCDLHPDFSPDHPTVHCCLVGSMLYHLSCLLYQQNKVRITVHIFLLKREDSIIPYTS